jgi:DNA-binding SARP family transcriptional activator
MPSLKLFVLGAPRLEQDDSQINLGRRKALAMLVYLVINEQPQTRESLLALLWPDYDPSSGRTNLRRDLSYLRRTLGGEFIVADRSQVGLNLEAGLWVDAHHFRALLATAQAHNHNGERLCESCATALTEAAGLHAGVLMAGFSLPDAPEFDEWLFFERESLRRELAGALQALVSHHVAQAEYETAIGYGRRWLALDPLHEPAHRELMQLYAWSGQQAAALRQYEESVRLLDAELGVAPEDETTALYEAIKLRRLQMPDRVVVQESVGVEEKSALHPISPTPLPDSIPHTSHVHNLPQQTTPFVGREQELAKIAGNLADPACRLITILGPGGIGKTRLGIEAAAQWAAFGHRLSSPGPSTRWWPPWPTRSNTPFTAAIRRRINCWLTCGTERCCSFSITSSTWWKRPALSANF